MRPERVPWPIALVAVVTTLVGAGCAGPPESPRPSERSGMAFVPEGTFSMGSRAEDRRVYDHERKREQPQHEFFVSAFYLDTHEVTNREFERFQPHLRDEASSCDTCPVTNVSWAEAQAYCAAQQPPKRLPTEAYPRAS